MDITCIKNDQYKLKGKKGFVELTLGSSIKLVSTANDNTLMIEQPGEYEVEGISVFAYNTQDSLSCMVQIEDVKILCSDVSIGQSLIDELGVVDVVLVGVGGGSNKEKLEMIGKIEPSYVIPSGDASSVANFVKEFEHTSRNESKLAISKTTLSSDVTEVVVLQ